MRSTACRHAALVLFTASLLAAGSAPRCRAQGWADTRVVGPFVCRADFSLAGTEKLLNELAQLQNDLVAHLRVPPANQWIELYLFHKESAYRKYVRRHFPDVPYRRALYLKRGGPGIVLAFQSRDLPTDLRHECTHALLHAVHPLVPLWLDEGLAEYFEVPPSERPSGSSHLSSVRWRAMLGMLPRISKLEKEGSVAKMGASDYRDAFAAVHFMLNGPDEARDELIAFLDGIRANSPPGLLSQRLARRVPDLERRMAAHFRSSHR